ncbi:MAG: LacI family DNA-binding transcriptional regulator [Ruminococcus sp.]|nr:LacI family DNA-binding transcriptional regulator [Ruminococcus sp.]
MVSLKDISVRCGVSVATVSKALNGHKDVSEATKERLIKAAKEMGYFPNSQARALKTNRTYNLGVMFLDEAGSGLTHEFFARLLNSFKTEAESAGYDITFINRDMGSRKMTTYEHCKYRNVDGVIIACTDFTSPDVYEVINGDIPVVTIDHTFECRSSVLSNNEQGIEELVDYAYSMGHRRIAYIQGNKSAVAEKRLKGFLQSMSSKGLEIRSDWILTADYHNPELTYKLTKKLLEGNDKPTCIFMPDDYSAIGGYNAIKDMGLTIGKDVSVVGYDGIAYATLVSPKLTTYAQDTEKIGAQAAKKLVALIEEPQTTFHEVITIGGSLVKGESVGKIN